MSPNRPTSGSVADAGSSDLSAAPLGWVLAVAFLGSLGTAVFWHGVSFVAKHAYGFEQSRNFLLYAMLGAVYAVTAWRAGAVTRRTARWVGPRGVLAWSLGAQSIACALPIVFAGEWALWASTLLVTVAAAIAWPIVESYLTAGRHGPAMRSAIGWFNLVWMSAMPVPMLLMGPILEEHGTWAIGGLTVTNAVACLILVRVPPRPAAHDEAQASRHVAREYPMLLRSARVLLPLSYLLAAAMAPILPYRFEAIGVAVWAETPITATWMIVRVVAMVIMWRLAFWQGRWGTLLLGAIAMAVGFALTVTAANVVAMVVGLAALGAGLGVVYYAALYYAMAVGRADVDASGTHEALIGCGYAIGPLAGLVGMALGGPAAIVGVVWTLVGMSAVPALLPYGTARRQRRGQEIVGDA